MKIILLIHGQLFLLSMKNRGSFHEFSSSIFTGNGTLETKGKSLDIIYSVLFLRRIGSHASETINSLDSPLSLECESMLLRCINFTIKGRYNRGYNFISTKQHGTSENSCKFLQ